MPAFPRVGLAELSNLLVPCRVIPPTRAGCGDAFRMYVGAAGRPDPRRRIDIAPGSRRLCESGDL